MANTDIVFKVSVDENGQGAKSLSDLKREFKDLQSELSKTKEGTDEYYQVLNKLGKIKDDMGDLRDEISALNPEGKVQAFTNVASKLASGFQAATGAAALFGVESAELEKTLLKVQAATAFAEGIRNVAGLTDAFKVLKTAIMSINPVMLIITGSIAAITAAYVLWEKVLSDTARSDAKLNDQLERQKNLQEEINDEISRNLELDKLRAESQSQVLKLELDAEIKRYAALRTRQLLLQQVSDKSEEQVEELKKLDKEEADSYNNLIKLKIQLSRQLRKEQDDALEADKKRNQEIAKQRKDDFAAQQKLEADAVDHNIKVRQSEREQLSQMNRDYLTSDQEDELAAYEESERIRLQKISDAEADAKKEVELAKLVNDAKRQAADNYFSAAQGLSDAYFNSELASAQGNEKAINDIRKKQFQVEKAFSIARAVIDGYRAVQAALVIPPPAGPILAASNAILAAANVAKIASTQFNSGAASTGNTVSAPASAPAPINTSVPFINRQDQTNLSPSGYNLNNKVYVTETDISSAQRRVNKIKAQSSY